MYSTFLSLWQLPHWPGMEAEEEYEGSRTRGSVVPSPQRLQWRGGVSSCEGKDLDCRCCLRLSCSNARYRLCAIVNFERPITTTFEFEAGSCDRGQVQISRPGEMRQRICSDPDKDPSHAPSPYNLTQ